MENETDIAPQGLRAKALRVHELLVQTYGHPTWRQHYDPVSELVLTFLSQNTSDVNSHRAFNQLRERYPRWEEVIDASPTEVAAAIRSGGLADIKAPRIQAALSRIMAEQGELSLDFLTDLPLKAAQDWLISLEGIGHKSAAIVLLFSFGRPSFPVDTHVHRVSLRLGIVAPKASRERAQAAWEALVPPDSYYPLHLNLIRHGRSVCKATRPLCSQCVLRRDCDWYSGQQ